MIRVLQINITANSGSHGRIAEGISDQLIDKQYESYIAYGRLANQSKSQIIKVGNKLDMALHVLSTRLFDRHGFGSERVTKSFCKIIKKIKPDLIHLHNIHGYYLNIKVLFKYIKKTNIPIIWTFHDCWPFTGHCSHFVYVNCNKWLSGCFDCPAVHGYPKSWLIDNSQKNYKQKKELFTGLQRAILVSPSKWLAVHLGNSFLSNYEIKVINNGIDLEIFRPVDNETVRVKYKIYKKYVLGVANTWTNKKGLADFFKLRKILITDFEIVLVGLTRKAIKSLPADIIGISRTESIDELAALYSGADVFVNPTYIDNFPTVNIEALACGTPVITYNTGGSPEAIDENTGIVIEKGNIDEMKRAIFEILNSTSRFSSDQCRARAISNFQAKDRFADYIEIYKEIIKVNQHCNDK